LLPKTFALKFMVLLNKYLRRVKRANWPVWSLALLIVLEWGLPQISLAVSTDKNNEVNRLVFVMDQRELSVVQSTVHTNLAERLPLANDRQPRYVIRVPVTAYSSTPDQTDSTPFITANGTNVRPGIVAANFLPFGTMIRLPSHFGNQVFVVQDRMNDRYDRRVDIWMESRQQAKQWGLRNIPIEVL